jgi:hypothetical protein
MSVSEMRDRSLCRPPGLRFAPSGLRLLVSMDATGYGYGTAKGGAIRLFCAAPYFDVPMSVRAQIDVRRVE